MHVYELPISLYGFKLRLAMALKGVAIELRSPPGGTYRSAEYREINPAGTIPALVDGDMTLSETDTIIEYLDDIGLGTPLLPAGARERARTRMISRWCDLRLEAAIRSLFPVVASAARNADIIATADARIEAALALIGGALDERGPFALGSTPGLVDCGLTATMAWHSALAPVLGLSAKPPAAIVRSLEAMSAHEKLAGAIAAYRVLPVEWVKAKG